LDPYFLLDITTEGRIVVLKFYNIKTNETLEIEDSEYRPYFFLPHSLTEADKEGIQSANGKEEVAVKRDLFTDETRKMTKISVYSKDVLRRASRVFEKAWETEVDYGRSYAYDHNLVFGAVHSNVENEPMLSIGADKETESKFDELFAEIETSDQLKYEQTKYWSCLLRQPVPQVGSEKLGLKGATAESMHKAFMLARIANIPVLEAYQSRGVSDWLKSIIHNYLRRNNVLIPTSTELRRGLETHRVPGALTVQPKPSTYFNTVICDFESLYPSCIDSYNLSYETVGCGHDECRNRVEECKEHWVCTKRRGFYSILIGALKDLRIHLYKPLSRDRTLPVQERKNAEVTAKLLKLISVSGYGVTVRIHGLACPPLAECITGYGRWALQTTWGMAEANGLHPTYGDTDSIFLDNPHPSQVENLITIAKERLKLDLAVERRYTLCVLPSAKKAYFGILPNGEPDIKGLTAIKSNSPNFIQKAFRDCVKELGNVRTIKEYGSAKKRIVTVVREAVTKMRNYDVMLEDLVYSVKLYSDPGKRLEADAKVTPQPYQCAIQLLDAGQKVARGDIVNFVKVRPFNYRSKTFTVKPAKHVRNVNEINTEDYIRNMTTALEQTFAPMNISLESEPLAKISDWFDS